MNIAIIIARGGSKRLPRKNIKLFCGHPLVSWAITQAKFSYTIDEVYVSTDDDEIAEISTNYGAKIIRRPDWPDADKVAANRVFCHALRVLKEKYGDDFSSATMMLPTNPLIRPGELDNGFNEFKRLGRERILPLIPLRETVVYKKVNTNLSRLIMFEKGYKNLGEGPLWSIANPNWYLTSFDEYPDHDEFLDEIENAPLLEISFIEAEYWQYADVDVEEEFNFAEVIMEHYILKGRGIEIYEDYYNSVKGNNAQMELNLSKYVGNIRQFGGD
jgi:CMP-N-acetylneuraminic acid synthetase